MYLAVKELRRIPSNSPGIIVKYLKNSLDFSGIARYSFIDNLFYFSLWLSYSGVGACASLASNIDSCHTLQRTSAHKSNHIFPRSPQPLFRSLYANFVHFMVIGICKGMH